MDEGKYLEPAHTVIRAFGDGDVSRGIKVVAEITQLHHTRVYRWMRPRTVNGTGGLIAPKYQQVLLEQAERRHVPLSARDFIAA